MNIRTRLTLLFSVIVASILLAFSLMVYLTSAEYREEEFFDRLEIRARSTVRLLVTVEEVDKDLLRIIDQNSVPALPEEIIVVFEADNSVAYSSREDFSKVYDPALLSRIRQEELVRFHKGNMEGVGVLYNQGDEQYIAVAMAYDRYGRRKLDNLRTILVAGFLVGIGIIVMAGWIFAGQVLAPLARMNQEVSTITAGNLDQRIDEGNRSDEIAQLAMNFNQMLERLQRSFDLQKSFVSHASHELRTPLATIQSQLQVALQNPRTPAQYEQILQSVLEYVRQLSELTNGLLLLARADMGALQKQFVPLRVDEVLFDTTDELLRRNPDYRVRFGNFPERESQLQLKGDPQLLGVVFLNLMDNACKYAPDHSVHLSLEARDGHIHISFADNGPGIPEGELDKIFTPFYRIDHTASHIRGHGIGLAMSKRIVEQHGGRIEVQSRQGHGTTFIVSFPLFNGMPAV